MSNPLVLSTTRRLVQWLQLSEQLEAAAPDRLEAIEANLNESLDCARELVTLMVREDFQDLEDNALPARQHRACLMLAAKLYRRDKSIYGESYVVGQAGDVAAILTSDPDLRRLLMSDLRARIGDATPRNALPAPLPPAADAKTLERWFGSRVLRGGRVS